MRTANDIAASVVRRDSHLIHRIKWYPLLGFVSPFAAWGIVLILAYVLVRVMGR